MMRKFWRNKRPRLYVFPVILNKTRTFVENGGSPILLEVQIAARHRSMHHGQGDGCGFAGTGLRSSNCHP